MLIQKRITMCTAIQNIVVLENILSNNTNYVSYLQNKNISYWVISHHIIVAYAKM